MAEMLMYHEGGRMLYPNLTLPEEKVTLTNLGRFAVKAAVSGGEPQGEIPDAGEIRKLAEKMQAYQMMEVLENDYLTQRIRSPRWRSAQRTGEDAGGEIVMKEVVLKIPLEEEKERKEQLSRELEELEALGSTEKGNEQASFSFENGEVLYRKKYTYTKPKTELVVPHDYIRGCF